MFSECSGKKKKEKKPTQTNEWEKALSRIYRSSLAVLPRNVTGAYDNEQTPFRARGLTGQLVQCNLSQACPLEHRAVKVQIFWFDISRRATEELSKGRFHYSISQSLI